MNKITKLAIITLSLVIFNQNSASQKKDPIIKSNNNGLRVKLIHDKNSRDVTYTKRVFLRLNTEEENGREKDGCQGVKAEKSLSDLSAN
jgi:hypothetical protein